MKLLRAATLSVANIENSIAAYCDWLDYTVEERGEIDSRLATSWGCPDATGHPYAILRPASGSDLFLRFVQQDPNPEFVPLTTYGWAAIELCVEDVLAANERILKSPFEVIGPPREIDGLPAIYPMQMLGPDGEVVYLTQIRDDLPDFDLPRAQSAIDCLFIMVLACSDMNASLDWFEEYIGLNIGRRKLEIVYTMLAKAFNLPEEDLHVIATMTHERDVFLEFDQMPKQAQDRPGTDTDLPAGVALATLWHPNFDEVDARCKDLWITPPAPHTSIVYNNKRAGTLRAPDGTLIEIIEQ